VFCVLSSVAFAMPEAPRPTLLALSLGQTVPRNATIDRASKQVDDGDFEDAVKTLERGIEAPDLTDAQLAELYRLLGLSHLYLGNEERARDAFEKLLQARPDYELPRATPPKIRQIYGRIKDDIRKRRVRPVTLSLSPVADAAGGNPVLVSAHIDDLALGARAKLFYRRAGAQNFSSIDFLREKGSRVEFTATIPAFELPLEEAAYEVEYYVEVADAAQRRLAGRGDAYTPLSFKVAARQLAAAVIEAHPWYKNPWVWVGVGVGAAAIATGAVVLATSQQTATLPIKIQIDGMP
jgi:tetratricopeptide (TPR) repeat protein